MKAPHFKGWFAKLPSLKQPQRRQVLDALHPAAGLDQVVALISEARAPGRCCPRCGNERCHRHGFASDCASGSTLGVQIIAVLPSCPAENATNCLTDPYGVSCIRLVQVRICQPTEGDECTPVPYQSVFPRIDLLLVIQPRATTIVTARTKGKRPGASACE